MAVPIPARTSPPMYIQRPWPVVQDEFEHVATSMLSILKESMNIVWDSMTSPDNKSLSEGDFVKVCDKFKTMHEGVTSMVELQRNTRHALLSCNIKNTYLHIASSCGKLHMVKELIKANPFQIDARNFRGIAPLHMAIWRGHFDIVHTLIKSGASIYLKAPHGLTPLHLAVKRGNLAMSKLLIASDLENRLVDEKSTVEGSALHIAILQKDVHIIKLLVVAGANLHNTDNKGQTCIDLGLRSEDAETSKLFSELIIGNVKNDSITTSKRKRSVISDQP